MPKAISCSGQVQVEVERRYSQCNVGHWTLAAFERQNCTTLPPLPPPPGVLLSPQVVPIGAFMALTAPLGQAGGHHSLEGREVRDNLGEPWHV